MKFFDQIFWIKNELEFFDRFIDIHRKHTHEHTCPKLKRNAANILPRHPFCSGVQETCEDRSLFMGKHVKTTSDFPESAMGGVSSPVMSSVIEFGELWAQRPPSGEDLPESRMVRLTNRFLRNREVIA